MDTMKGLKRTCYCNEVSLEAGEVTVGGWVARVRDKGGIIFTDVDGIDVIQNQVAALNHGVEQVPVGRGACIT